MENTAKYLIHADVTADGVVERSDVVGAVFGQTEGLLGTEMDLRKLQDTSKIGRIDVSIDSERGRSFGELTIASRLDQVETAVLAASLETISRVGPCRAEVTITAIEDVRAAKRRKVVDRAKELMTDTFDDSVMTTQEILDEVRKSVRVEDVTEYEGLPAGPHVEDSDAIIVVEGRSDVVRLLQYGIKNAVAVEGTNVPDAVGDLTEDRTVTAFFDGDRGGDLILKELAQVGSVDFVALTPPGRSVEDLSRKEVTESLREKMPYEAIADGDHQLGSTDGDRESTDDGTATAREPGSGESARTDPTVETGTPKRPEDAPVGEDLATRADDPGGDGATADDERPDEGDGSMERPVATDGSTTRQGGAVGADEQGTTVEPEVDEPAAATNEPSTMAGHARDVVEDERGTVRVLDESFDVVAEAPTDDAFETIDAAGEESWAVVLDGELTQRLLDVAAQRGFAQVVARRTGEYVKRPANVRILTADQLLGEQPA